MIELINIKKSFGANSVFAVSNISLNIKRGEFLGLIGESGSGKTTTLKMINRLEEPSSGEIRVNGRNIRDSNEENYAVTLAMFFKE